MEKTAEGNEKKLTVKEKRELALEQLKARAKKLEAKIAEEAAKEEKKNFLPLGRAIYTLCVEKKLDLSDPDKLMRWVEAYFEFGLAAGIALKSVSNEQKQGYLIAIAANCEKESTTALLASLGYQK